MTDCPVVETKDLTKHYGDAVALESLDLSVARGEILGFLGPNGAGKTTTIRCLLDLIRPTRGRAWVFGRSPQDPEVRLRIGYLPGELELDDRMTGDQMLRFLGRLRPDGVAVDLRRRGELCERLRLTDADLHRQLRADSRGTKQKVGLVAAFQHDPELLILDEPTTGLDPLVREGLFELLRDAGRAGRTVFHSSHVLSEVDRTCTRVAMLREGRLVALEDIERLRRTLTRKMVLRFRAPLSVTELEVPGIEILEHGVERSVLRITGDLNPLLAALARHPVDHLSFPEPDLDDAFRHHYDGGAP